MRAVLLYLFTISVIVSCATPTKEVLPPTTMDYLPPNLDFVGDKDKESLDLQLLGIASKYPDKNAQWWVNYRRARLWEKEKPGTSCLLYLDLAQTRQFPLHQIARLRSFATCTKEDMARLPMNQLDPEQFPEWMKPIALEIALTNSRRDKDLNQNYSLAMQKSKLALPYNEKVELTQEAIKLATTLAKKDLIESAQNRLQRLAPRFKSNPSKSDYLDVAYDYRRAREFSKSRRFYQRVIDERKGTYADKVKAYKGIRMAFKNERKKPEYLQATLDLAHYIEKTWAKKKRPPYALSHQHHESQIMVARTYWTLGQPAPAQKILVQLSQSLKGKHSLDEIFWLRGRMAEERGHYAESVRWFDKGIAELKGKKSEALERIQWYRAWNLRKLRNYAEAKLAFEELKNTTDNEFSRSRYAFWLAMTLKNLELSDESKVVLRELIQDDPIGYYGLLAHRELQTPVSIPGLSATSPSGLKEPKIQANYQNLLEVPYTEWLISVGERDIANRYLDHVSMAYRKFPNQDESTWVGLFRYYARSGVYLSLYNQLGLLEPVQRNSILNHYPDLIFPTPYSEYVTSASNRYGVSSELIYSIMRQESAFNPEARSPADAFGLMQLLPEVAAKTASNVHLDFENDEDLYEPHINIPIGSAYLRELWDKFNGQFILTVASYNASEEAIYGWLRTRFRGDTLEFIEDIPYEETRSYVRLVMRNLVFYSLMTAGGKAIPFPEWALALSAPSSLQ